MRIGLMVWKGSRPHLAAPGQNLVRAVPGCRHPPEGDSSNFRRIQGFELSVEGAEAKPGRNHPREGEEGVGRREQD